MSHSIGFPQRSWSSGATASAAGARRFPTGGNPLPGSTRLGPRGIFCGVAKMARGSHLNSRVGPNLWGVPEFARQEIFDRTRTFLAWIRPCWQGVVVLLISPVLVAGLCFHVHPCSLVWISPWLFHSHYRQLFVECLCFEFQGPSLKQSQKPRRVTDFAVILQPCVFSYPITGWWFGTFLIFPFIGNNHPNWLRGSNHQPAINCESPSFPNH